MIDGYSLRAAAAKSIIQIILAALALGFIIGILIGVARAQVVGTDADGKCWCEHEGKKWACRRAVDYTSPRTCNLNLNLTLVCPEDRSALCSYLPAPTICTDTRVMPVCYMADKPR